MPMRSSAYYQVSIRLFAVLSIPTLVAGIVFSLLTLTSTGYISSAKVQLLRLDATDQVYSTQYDYEELYNLQSNLAIQFGEQLKNPRLLYLLACRVSAFDLEDPVIRQKFQEDTGIYQADISDVLQEKLYKMSWQTGDSLSSYQLDSLIDISLYILGNHTSSFSYKIHHQWIPSTYEVRIKAYDNNQKRANFIVNTVCELAIEHQLLYGGQNVREVIDAQRLLIEEKKNYWEGSKDRIRTEHDEIMSGRGPRPIRELRKKIHALQKSKSRLEGKIRTLKRKLQNQILEEKRNGKIIRVSHEQSTPDDLLLDINRYLGESRIIKTELKALQEKLQKYEEKHLNKFREQEKNNRIALLEAQSYLQKILNNQYGNLGKIKLLEPARTMQPNTGSDWLLTAFSFFATLALWIIFLLKINFFR